MHFTTITTLITTIALATTGVVANPIAALEPVDAANQGSVIESRAVPLVDLYDQWNYAGAHYAGKGGPWSCYNLPAGFINLSSSGKAVSGYQCTVYSYTGCSSQSSSDFIFFINAPRFPGGIDNWGKSWKFVPFP